MSSVFLFGHNEMAVISQNFWVTFEFDSSLDILLRSKSSFESYLVNLFFFIYGICKIIIQEVKSSAKAIKVSRISNYL